MHDPVTGTTIGKIMGGSLTGATFYGLITNTDFGVVFGAFAGAVFYVATAANVNAWRLVGFFTTSFIVGVLGAGVLGSWLGTLVNIDKPLDALSAVLISALCIRILTFMNEQGVKAMADAFIGFLTRFRGGGPRQ